MEVIVTSNRVRLVSLAPSPGRRRLRVAARLLDLGEPAAPAIAAFALGKRGARGQLQELFGQLAPSPEPRRRRRVALRPQGVVHDLEALMALELSSAPDLDPAGCAITWGRRRRLRSPQRSLRLGAYAFEEGVIRMHPLLDDELVPAWFVGFVVFHELLHHHFGVVTRGGRRVVHPRPLRVREAAHPRHGDAAAWERQHLAGLMRNGRLGWAAR